MFVDLRLFLVWTRTTYTCGDVNDNRPSFQGFIAFYETTTRNKRASLLGNLGIVWPGRQIYECGVPTREARLVGGEYLTGHEFPWAASIQVQGGNVSLPATLITPKYLLTSANNVIGKTALDLKITVGQLDRCFSDSTSLNVSVDNILIHPDYDPATKAHDISLIRLNTPVRVDKRILPICLPSPNYNYIGQVGTVYGWSNSGNISCKARKLGLPILNQNECKQGYPNNDLVTSEKGCIGVLGSLNPICKNESGTPVMFKSKNGNYDIVGILGDKNECEEIGVALFTKVNDHLTWIFDNTADSCYCKKLHLSIPTHPLRIF